MHIALINGSPKLSGKGSTAALLTMLKSRLDPALVLTEYSAAECPPAALLAEDALVIASPLYVDALPSALFRLLGRLEEAHRRASAKTPPRIYALVQNGFYEGQQTRIALEIIRHWCTCCGFAYCQGLGCGAGGMLPGFAKRETLGQGALKSLGAALDTIAAHIAASKRGPDIFLTLDIPYDDWLAQTDRAFLLGAAHHGLSKADLSRCAINF